MGVPSAGTRPLQAFEAPVEFGQSSGRCWAAGRAAVRLCDRRWKEGRWFLHVCRTGWVVIKPCRCPSIATHTRHVHTTRHHTGRVFFFLLSCPNSLIPFQATARAQHRHDVTRHISDCEILVRLGESFFSRLFHCNVTSFSGMLNPPRSVSLWSLAASPVIPSFPANPCHGIALPTSGNPFVGHPSEWPPHQKLGRPVKGCLAHGRSRLVPVCSSELVGLRVEHVFWSEI